eukprot:CAMPEP_0202823586 /NCGR_PEP_ID=MMETSP1389-20130828/11777_1 /ASSEMBLY_ACC=CAM_ASM_000865 /TAXON_ID=302021 /ORGANISM="Rhodomonas sp., Strain CCMP768" /LENGTH=204 /DNA_ID=CAMNT_0049496581 /DNA_START=37 /DNA_END=651 /DNA_ORIENTATION=-
MPLITSSNSPEEGNIISQSSSHCKISSLENNSLGALNGFAAEFTPAKSPNTGSQPTPSKLDMASKSLSWTEPSTATEEISVAARYWARSMRQHDLAGCEVAAFETALKQAMLKRCAGHWYPSEPMRGSGHRSVINDFSTDPVIIEAADAVRISDIGARLPRAVMWLNPGSVKIKLEGRPWAESLYSANASSSGTSGSEEEDNDM